MVIMPKIEPAKIADLRIELMLPLHMSSSYHLSPFERKSSAMEMFE